MPTLAILNGALEGQVFDLDKPIITLGRRADNDVAVTLDPRISRFHAQLSQRGQEWLLEDLGSANGTFVGQRKIHGPTVIRPGDRFRLGRTWLALVPEPIHTSEAEARERVQLTEEEPVDLLGTPAEESDALAPEVSTATSAPQSVVYSLGLDQPQRPTDEKYAQRWLEVMGHVSRSLASTLDLGQLLDVIIESIMAVMPADAGFVILVDRKTGELVPKAMRQRGAGDAQIAVSRHILEYALAERAALMTADAMSDARFENLDSVQDLRLRSTICAPLFHGEEALGAIFLEARSATGAFTEQDVEMLRSIAAQAATAIENARLYTDVRQALDTVQQAQEQLLRSERLSTIGALSASIAHDMANIVTPLKPLLKLALRDQDTDPDLTESLNRQMDRLTTLLERLMSFSKSETHLGSVNVNELLQKTVTLIRSEIYHRNVELVMDLAEDVPPVLGDAAQLDRVFLNVCMNALEAMETMPEGEERALTIKTERDGEEVAISFSDTGPGISEADQERLFEPLFTTKETGTGLGLHSCKRIVEEEHRGTIEVDSMEGIGATFTVRLPATP
ncbi:FHA domain-containing protein [bacterium]|nr:FHA domain-containing protein [bacterium]